MSSWNDPGTASYYEAFCRTHSRYRRANAALIAHAAIFADATLLDFAAGTGRTAEAALRRLGEDGRVLCVEPYAGMRTLGMRRITDPRVTWSSQLPDVPESFDRILCGAAIWQMRPLCETLRSLARLLRPKGALCFNIPASYLMEPDEPGGGADPLLLSLATLLSASRVHESATDPADLETAVPLDGSSILEWLGHAGLRAESWRLRLRMTQDDYAAWLKIPVLTDRVLGDLKPRERAQRIDVALNGVDRSSWKWERWRGWTAWKV